jgi:molybdopterin-containing oxidoreductase family iron-sulfur binding subunit
MSSVEPKRLWRSLNELENSEEFEEFVRREFPQQVDMLKSPLSRRRFMQLMGASLALSGVGACRWEKERIVPLSRRPEDYVPGVARRFATAMEIGGVAQPLLATSYDGRPIGISPNPDHEYGAVGTTAFSQASILGLYDPDRSTSFRAAQGPTPSATQVRAMLEEIGKNGGEGWHILAEPTSSPTIARLRETLREKHPGVRWHEWEPLSRDNEREGLRQAFGTPYRARLSLQPGTPQQAQVLVCLDADVCHDSPDSLRVSRDLAAARSPNEPGNQARPLTRVYAIEAAFTTTGAMADHRLPIRPSQIASFVRELETAVQSGQAPAAKDRTTRFLHAVAEDLLANAGKGAVACGYRQPPEVHAAVARINAKLGNAGQNVTYSAVSDPERAPHVDQIRALAGQMKQGKVKTLLILGGNPVYDAPVDVDFASALAKVPRSIHLSSYVDETSALTTHHIPRAHYLESWGDTLTYDGTYTVVQPLIDPMYPDVRSPIDILKILCGRGDDDNRALIAATAKMDGKAFDAVVCDGFIKGSAAAASAAPAPSGAAPAQAPAAPLSDASVAQITPGQLEIVFMPSNATYDGRFANNAWLQELPDFITKLCWDNALCIGPQTSSVLKIKDNDVVTLSIGSQEVDLPVCVLPGVAPGTAMVALGYGRTHAGHVGGWEAGKISSVGKNLYPLRQSRALYSAVGEIRRTGKTYVLASTQEHWAIDKIGMKGREKRAGILVQEATQEQYTKNPDFVTRMAEIESVVPLTQTKTQNQVNESLWKEFSYEGYKWGMAIDLSKCFGCSACVTACQSENNVAVVGREQVIANREMHWLRIDRYFAGDPNSPTVAYQPVTCQQCENAPCEQVCPVGATIHSDEGLNDMAYNRCVGTRYCLNNCPYKVRRFNYFYYWKELDDPKNESRKLAFNPEVTVRSRGVMEKCTFCVQRIQNVKIKARNDGRRVVDGEIKTACQEACPTNAIVFGDLNSDSEVKRAHNVPRSYALLPELNTKPRNAYMARITNPNPTLHGEPAKGGGHE